MQTYNGSCHCGAVSFAFDHEDITGGLRCTCSICRRKGAIMSDFTLPAEALQIRAGPDALGLYQFDTRIAKHFFCRTCGIYPFHETVRKPGEYRVNLGCIDDLDLDVLDVKVFDGKNLL